MPESPGGRGLSKRRRSGRSASPRPRWDRRPVRTLVEQAPAVGDAASWVRRPAVARCARVVWRPDEQVDPSNTTAIQIPIGRAVAQRQVCSRPWSHSCRGSDPRRGRHDGAGDQGQRAGRRRCWLQQIRRRPCISVSRSYTPGCGTTRTIPRGSPGPIGAQGGQVKTARVSCTSAGSESTAVRMSPPARMLMVRWPGRCERFLIEQPVGRLTRFLAAALRHGVVAGRNS